MAASCTTSLSVSIDYERHIIAFHSHCQVPLKWRFSFCKIVFSVLSSTFGNVFSLLVFHCLHQITFNWKPKLARIFFWILVKRTKNKRGICASDCDGLCILERLAIMPISANGILQLHALQAIIVYSNYSCFSLFHLCYMLGCDSLDDFNYLNIFCMIF